MLLHLPKGNGMHVLVVAGHAADIEHDATVDSAQRSPGLLNSASRGELSYSTRPQRTRHPAALPSRATPSSFAIDYPIQRN